MKKRRLFLPIILALFLGISILSLGNEAYIASFNILRLGASKKDMPQTAKLLQGFDIVGLVEVMNKDGVEELVDELNKQSDEKWDYHISPFGVGSSKYKEYFAYVYKKDKVKFLKSEGFYKDGKSSLLREPYGATFKIGNFDFTLVLVHTIYGNNEAQRKAENFKMVDVYEYFQDRDTKENDIFNQHSLVFVNSSLGNSVKIYSLYIACIFLLRYECNYESKDSTMKLGNNTDKIILDIVHKMLSVENEINDENNFWHNIISSIENLDIKLNLSLVDYLLDGRYD